MWHSQREWWDLQHFIKIFVGGYGVGKTQILCKRAVYLTLKNAPYPGALVSPTFTQARDTTIFTLDDMLERKATNFKRGEFAWEYHGTNHEYRIRLRNHRGVLKILSGDDSKRLKGSNLAWFGMDECFLQEEAVFEQMLARCRHPGAKKREAILGGTPENLGWGYDLCVGDLKEKNDVGYVRAATMENLALPPEYVERLRAKYDPRAFQAFVEGKFVSLSEGLVYYSFDLQEHVVELGIPDGAILGAGVDFNIQDEKAPMSAAIFWKLGERIHFFDELQLPNRNTEWLCRTIREKYLLRLNDLYPDPSGNQRHSNAEIGVTDFSIMERLGFKVYARRRAPGLKDRYNAVNGKLTPRNGRVSLTISPKCKSLMKSLSTYSHEKKQAELSHILDAFGYPVEYLFPINVGHEGMGRLVGA